MKRFLLLALLPMLLVGCEPENNVGGPQCPPGMYNPPLFRVYSFTNYHFDFDRRNTSRDTFEDLLLTLDGGGGYDLPSATVGGRADIIIFAESGAPGTPTVLMPFDNTEQELPKSLPSVTQLAHLTSQLIEEDDDLDYPIYVHAAIEDIIITADKTLWGIEAGGNLMDQFGVMGRYSHVNFATYDVIQPRMQVLALADVKGALLQEIFYLCPIDVPAEKYEQITFMVKMDFLLPSGQIRTASNSITVEFEN